MRALITKTLTAAALVGGLLSAIGTGPAAAAPFHAPDRAGSASLTQPVQYRLSPGERERIRIQERIRERERIREMERHRFYGRH